MNNFKKIGLTALAASLVSVSANAGDFISVWFSVNEHRRSYWYWILTLLLLSQWLTV